VYMQTEDPATTGQPMQAGAIWIKPLRSMQWLVC
jgi:hypothetical protein